MIDFKIPAGLEERLQNKKIYIWGAWEVGELLLELLRNANLNVCAYLDGKAFEDSYHGLPIIKSDRLTEISSEEDSVILVASVEHASIRKALNAAGFVDGINMYYLGAPVEISGGINYYEDICGNAVHSMSALPLFNVGMFGHIKVGRNVSIGSNVKLIAWGGSTLEIGDNVKIGDNCVIEARDCSSITISNGCKIEKSVLIRDVNNSQVVFGEKNKISKGNDFYCNNSKISVGNSNNFSQDVNARFFNNSSLVIGNNCAVSYQVKMRGENGHTIIDLENKTARPSQKQISIANHVWIGMGVSLLGGTTIGENSIVGADSFVSKEFGSNVMIVGSPAKVIRENVTWDDAPDLTYEEWEEKQGN